MTVYVVLYQNVNNGQVRVYSVRTDKNVAEDDINGLLGRGAHDAWHSEKVLDT